MRNYTVNNEFCVESSRSEHFIKLRRSSALLLDLLFWYLLYITVVFLLFLFIYGIPTISEDVMYKEHIDFIITSKTFITLYLGSLALYEILVTVAMNGQSLSKRIFNLRISYGKHKIYSLTLRGAIKIFILNPYGTIAYLGNQMIPLISTNTYADIMLFALAGCAGLTLFSRTGKSIHDRISHTYVIKNQ
jgi:uncharacterized RDD family membrane protein YckC